VPAQGLPQVPTIACRHKNSDDRRQLAPSRSLLAPPAPTDHPW
jgi:hypothetical protein